MSHGPGISYKALIPDRKYKFFWRKKGKCGKPERSKGLCN